MESVRVYEEDGQLQTDSFIDTLTFMCSYPFRGLQYIPHDNERTLECDWGFYVCERGVMKLFTAVNNKVFLIAQCSLQKDKYRYVYYGQGLLLMRAGIIPSLPVYHGAKITRVDVSKDFFACSNELPPVNPGDWNGKLTRVGMPAETIYVGSRKSDFFVRIYNKTKELKKHSQDLCFMPVEYRDCPTVWRVEEVYKSDKCKKVLNIVKDFCSHDILYTAKYEEESVIYSRDEQAISHILQGLWILVDSLPHSKSIKILERIQKQLKKRL